MSTVEILNIWLGFCSEGTGRGESTYMTRQEMGSRHWEGFFFTRVTVQERRRSHHQLFATRGKINCKTVAPWLENCFVIYLRKIHSLSVSVAIWFDFDNVFYLNNGHYYLGQIRHYTADVSSPKGKKQDQVKT